MASKVRSNREQRRASRGAATRQETQEVRAGVGLVCEPALIQEGGRLGPAAPPRPARLLVPVPTTSSPGLYLGLGVSSVGLIVFLVGLGRPPTLPAGVTLQ